jgi:hypothetical protein
MRKSSLVPGSIMLDSSSPRPERRGPAASGATGQDAGDRTQAAQGPVPETVSAAKNPVSIPVSGVSADGPAEALGRRIVSTAFVMVGPDGQLTVELRNGHTLVLRNMVMHPRDYCGLHVAGGLEGKEYCGRYADVVAARPGGLAAPVEPGPATSNPLEPERRPSRHN